MKVTPVSEMVTTPAFTAACTAAPDVRGVGVPLITTVEARFRVKLPPESRVPEIVSAVHEEVPDAALG